MVPKKKVTQKCPGVILVDWGDLTPLPSGGVTRKNLFLNQLMQKPYSGPAR